MSRGYPSMTALLGLLAIAGYQNRDKIAEMLRGAQSNPADPAAPPKTGGREATPGNLGGILGGASIGETLSGGLRELMDAFRQKGQGELADSWVARGPNKQIAPAQLEYRRRRAANSVPANWDVARRDSCKALQDFA